jgi:hypothetical protein
MINYNQDFYGWTQEQASLLKAGRLNELDIINLIEEVETMGRSEKRELQSRLTVLLMHLLKWKHQSNRRGRSWTLTIIGQRLRLASVIKDNPGLKAQLPDLINGVGVNSGGDGRLIAVLLGPSRRVFLRATNAWL